ncbi:MAG: hypothetical protein NZ902_02020 [Acidilobaceae archaeon]|nr:hypothetical protein [Acidilobaceae archaeon]MCX8165599.1 hypothetical protein [Acidilobaceae archaeon]MDW7974026.1 hypothetical protein [Sulfolobales archaeon]
MEVDRLGHCRGIVLLLDTNMILLLAGGEVSLARLEQVLEMPFVPLVPSSVMEELRSLSSRHEARVPRRALELVQVMGAKVVETRGSADDSLVELAMNLKSKCRVVVATSDRELRSRLKLMGIPTLYYRAARGDVELEWSPL